VIVKLNPASLDTWAEGSVFDKPPSSHDKIGFLPITVDRVGVSDGPPLAGSYTILATESLTIENVSHLITPDTFSLWKQDCLVSQDIAIALENVGYAIVHRSSSPIERHRGPSHAGRNGSLIYKVRNASAHGQKVPDPHFAPVTHPLGQRVIGIEALAEAATFIIRKTVVEILQRKWRDKFKDRDSRENFWLMEYALPKNQGKKRLKELADCLGQS